MELGSLFGDSSSAWVQQLEGRFADAINASRREAEVPELPTHYDLVRVGRDHSLAMLTGGFFDHTDLRGRSPQQRLTSAGILFDRGDELIAFSNNRNGVGTADLDDILAELRNGAHPDQVAIMHDPGWTEMGVGITVSSNQRSLYLTALFIEYPEHVIGVRSAATGPTGRQVRRSPGTWSTRGGS